MGVRHRGAARALPGRRADLRALRLERGATPACGSAPRSASSRAGPRQADVRRRRRRSTSFGLWAEQLVAESTGKQGKGILPVADEPLGDSPDAYGDDRVFVYLRNVDEPDERARRARSSALAAAGHPTITLPRARRRPTSAGIFFFAEFAVAVAGWALEINPFDQPNVQEAKDNTSTRARRYRATLPDGRGRRRRRAARAARPTPSRRTTSRSWATCRAVGRVRRGGRASCATAIRAATGAATTFGYGPRFLHSTGQLHKGGPPTGASCSSSTTPSATSTSPAPATRSAR